MIADAPVRKRERNTEIKADYRRPSEGEEENIEMRAGDESGLHRLLLDLCYRNERSRHGARGAGK